MKSNTVGNKIKYYRTEKNWTQQKLADKIGISWEMISRYERGSSSPLKNITKISKALDVTPNQLLDDPDDPEFLNHFERVSIPLFLEKPKERDFNKNLTKFFYNAPEWIHNIDEYCFAISTNFVKIDIPSIRNNGILFIKKSDKYERDSIILILRGIEYAIIYASEKTIDDEPIGILIAQEVRYV